MLFSKDEIEVYSMRLMLYLMVLFSYSKKMIFICYVVWRGHVKNKYKIQLNKFDEMDLLQLM